MHTEKQKHPCHVLQEMPESFLRILCWKGKAHIYLEQYSKLQLCPQLQGDGGHRDITCFGKGVLPHMLRGHQLGRDSSHWLGGGLTYSSTVRIGLRSENHVNCLGRSVLLEAEKSHPLTLN